MEDWIQTQRRHIKDKDTETNYLMRKSIIEQTFHDWSWDLNEDIWMENFNLLKNIIKNLRIHRYQIMKLTKIPFGHMGS